MGFETLYSDVIKPDLCTRCGICMGVCPVGVIGLGENNFPVLEGDCIDCNFCVKSCPGAEVDFPLLSHQLFKNDYDPDNLQGFVEKTFVAHAAEDRIRSTYGR